MSETQKILAAVVGVFVVGFLLIFISKEQEKEVNPDKSKLITYSSMQGMASQKCPPIIEEKTGTRVFFPSSIDSDKDTYVTMNWKGENDDHFKTASCTLKLQTSGIRVTNVTIDGKVVVDKEKE
jgi:hypothetical protein